MKTMNDVDTLGWMDNLLEICWGLDEVTKADRKRLSGKKIFNLEKSISKYTKGKKFNEDDWTGYGALIYVCALFDHSKTKKELLGCCLTVKEHNIFTPKLKRIFANAFSGLKSNPEMIKKINGYS